MARKTVDFSTVLRAHIEEKPYQAIAVAAGVGLMLGGGLWKHMARSFLSIGGRLAVTAAMTQIADALQHTGEAADEPKHPRAKTHR